VWNLFCARIHVCSAARNRIHWSLCMQTQFSRLYCIMIECCVYLIHGMCILFIMYVYRRNYKLYARALSLNMHERITVRSLGRWFIQSCLNQLHIADIGLLQSHKQKIYGVCACAGMPTCWLINVCIQSSNTKAIHQHLCITCTIHIGALK
jgi:hypothetical protein